MDTERYDRLAQWKAVRGLESVWFINADTKAATIRDDLLSKIDTNDRLFVGVLSGETAWHGLMDAAAKALRQWFGA